MVVKTTRVRTLALGAMVMGVMACGKKGKDKDEPAGGGAGRTGTLNVQVTAQGVNSILESQALRLLGVEDEDYGYQGIGMNYGDAVVDGLKIKLKSISMQTMLEGGGYGTQVELANFGEGKELEIAEGFNGKVEAKQDVQVPEGVYKQVGVMADSSFSLKAYAYLDRDNDGHIDTTVWTTATEIKMDSQKLAPGAMPGYDYFRYPWLVVTTAKNLTDNSANPTLTTTNLPEPLTATADGIASKDATGAESVTKELNINLLVDTFRIIKVWDGRYAAGGVWTPGSGDASTIPAPVFPYPQGANDTRILSDGLKTTDFFPAGKPAFALSNYLSVFAMVNRTGLKAQNYVISKQSSISPYNSQVMTLVLDGDGTPLFGKLTLGESNETLHIGPTARKFVKQEDASYTFGTAYGAKDETGKFDGGLMYSDDLAKAGHLFTGFRKLAVGQRGQMTMKNGPRCKEEYDYCVAADGVPAYFLRAQ